MNLISTRDFTTKDVNRFIDLAEDARQGHWNFSPHLKKLKRKILATLFYEPSTRTRLSFESAMLRLKGKVISVENAQTSSSWLKGESLEDTLKIVSSYADVIVLRDSIDLRYMEEAVKYSKVPVINAGNGSGEHPTQALQDMYTIWREFSYDFNDKHYVFVGDLRYGRTVHSLVQLFSLYNVRMTFVSQPDFSMPGEVLNFISQREIGWVETKSLHEALGNRPDVVYLTRMQTERTVKRADTYVFGEKEMEMVDERAIIMHPLPRGEELPLEIDKYENAAYFRQAENGLWMRMGILSYLLS